MKTLEQINKKISAVFGKQKILKIQNRAVRELKPKEIQATIKIGNLVQVDTSLGAMIIELSRLEKYLAYAKAEKATLWNFYSLYGACPHDWNDALWKVERALNLLKSAKELESFTDELNQTDLMENKEIASAIDTYIANASKRLAA